MDSPLFVLTILCFNVMLAIWLERNTRLRHLGAALMSIIITAVTANIGLIPSASSPSVVYGAIFNYVAPISIFFLLLGVSLKQLKQAGKPMLILFGIGTGGTCLGVLTSHYLLGSYFGDNAGPLAGMITGTYTGGSINFNAIALHYNMMEQGILYAAIVSVDNILTAFWMVVTILIPKIKQSTKPAQKKDPVILQGSAEYDTAQMSIFSLTILFLTGLGALWISNELASLSGVPSILILTTIALILAQIPFFHSIREAKIMGLLLVYLFLAVVGAFCELVALSHAGEIAGYVFLYLFIVVAVHGIFIYGIGTIFKFKKEMISVASQANVGGSSSALALARSLGRDDLLLAAVLLGALGNALGTYIGFLMAGL